MSEKSIIKELKVQIEACESSNEDINKADWEGYNGVLITGNQAKEIIKLLETKNNELDLSKCNTYRKILAHRNNCPKWTKEFCIDCFGGGLSKFLKNVSKEKK